MHLIQWMLLSLRCNCLHSNENDTTCPYSHPAVDQSTITDMLHPSSQDEIVRDRDSGYASSYQGSKKLGTRGNIISKVLTTIHKLKREGKPDTPEYVPRPTVGGEDEGFQGVCAREIPTIECPEAVSQSVSPSNVTAEELDGVPISDKPPVTAHPDHSGRQDRTGGRRRSHFYNTAEHPRINHPTANNFGPPTDSTAGHTSYGINGPYHQNNSPRQEYPPEEIAHFSRNIQLSNETQIVGLRSSGRTRASDRDIMNTTANWELQCNNNHGLGDQVVGQMVLDGVRPRQHAGQFTGNENWNGGQQVVGMDF